MNINIADKPVNILREDNDGNVYSIPEHRVDDFTYKVEEIMNSEWGSTEWHSAIDELEAEYGQFQKKD